tara:strand:- start:2156 stop:4708 length:2553 start_codon:yes stop_codon:yes gene_type:complete
MPIVSNEEFLKAAFAEDAPFTHVTDFTEDPNDIPKERHLTAWKGDYYHRYHFKPVSNQYFTISHFYGDEQGIARRRKALYRHTRVIVLDDVREKLDMVEVEKLPAPSWILETSPGSEQWGYILNEPCTERSRVENLLDGLVANGLAPAGKDPGMKGVTRYVRLPEGYNNKASKLVNGQPFKCTMLLWNPFSIVTLEELAAPFVVNLDAVRREARVDGAADVPDHPLVNIPDLIQIKEVRSDGRFDIVCPWVSEHTDGDDSGAAIFTNDDRTIGFKCHHGSCQERTARDLLRWIDEQDPSFAPRLRNWTNAHMFADLNATTFMQPVERTVELANNNPLVEVLLADPLQNAMDQLRRINTSSPEAQQIATVALKVMQDMGVMERQSKQDELRQTMGWNKQELKTILKELQSEWYDTDRQSKSFFDDIIYIKEQNQFYDYSNRIFYTPEAFQNSYAHEDYEARKSALQEGRVDKVDKLDYAPKKPRIFEEDGLTYGNAWSDVTELQGVTGDPSPWLDHWALLGWSEHRQHMLEWMAYTVQHPENKINHMMLLGSLEGAGKDFLLAPLLAALGENATTISGDELMGDFQEYLLRTKYLHINEAELGDRKEALEVSNKLKPIAAAPPKKLSVNQKGIKRIQVRNIINGTMTTNSQLPLRLNGPTRRFFAVWSDLNVRDHEDNMTPEWKAYWNEKWTWMESGGAEACIWYLRNCVDLRLFNPATPPPVTEFLRDIREASKTPHQITLEVLIQRQFGSFACDLLTTDDVIQTMKSSLLNDQDIAYCDMRSLTPSRVSQALKTLPGVNKTLGRRKYENITLWVIRNHSMYRDLTGGELHDAYLQQKKRCVAQPMMRVV